MTDQNPTTSTEIFKPIPDYPGYDISNRGQVRSYWKQVGNGRGHSVKWVMTDCPQRILRTSLSAGYPHVALRKEGNRFIFRIHILVLLAFIGPCPPGLQCCHNNGNPTKNLLENLRYDTLSNNQLDRRKHGTDNAPCGEAHCRAKLTEADVRKIREMYAQGGYTHKMLANLFCVATPQITNIINRKAWKHVPYPVDIVKVGV